MTLEEIFQAMGIVGRDNVRLDANETAFLTRQIEHVRSKTYEVKYANLLARGFIPTATDIPSWAQNVVEVVYDSNGRARVVANGADDQPRVDVTASESTIKVVSLGAAYGFNMMDLRQAAATGVPLSDKKAMAARRAIDTAIDEILATGKLDSVGQAFNGVGILSASVYGGSSVTPGTGASWFGQTVALILTDIANLLNKVDEETKQLFAANTVLCAPREWNILNTKEASSFTNDTIMTVLRRIYPGVTFEKWHRCTDASGTPGTNRVLAYAKDPEVIEAIVPQEFEQIPPQLRNFETLINCHARCGGVRVHHPKAFAYMDLDATV